MTYEQAVATAFLNAFNWQKKLQKKYGVYKYRDLTTATYALRRLRVRAGLVP